MLQLGGWGAAPRGVVSCGPKVGPCCLEVRGRRVKVVVPVWRRLELDDACGFEIRVSIGSRALELRDACGFAMSVDIGCHGRRTVMLPAHRWLYHDCMSFRALSQGHDGIDTRHGFAGQESKV